VDYDNHRLRDPLRARLATWRQASLDFDVPAAAAAASLAGSRQKAGRPVDFRDALIAGIAQARRAMLATRNVRHFQDFGIQLVDPWRA
jgi:predicted nucleic acid-binding protein